jgi:AraC-like DNA-binding protein
MATVPIVTADEAGATAVRRPADGSVSHPREEELMEELWTLARTVRPVRLPAPRLAAGGIAPRTLRRIREHIERQIERKISLSDLARLAGLSAGHFSRAFRSSVGVPPYRYLRQRRIAAGSRLIRDTDRPIAEIALSVGFSDQSHFTRAFVRVRGETPAAFRRRHR